MILGPVPAAALCFLGIVFQEIHVVFDYFAVTGGEQIDDFLIQIVKPGDRETEFFQRWVT